jgi:hypothetical protein
VTIRTRCRAALTIALLALAASIALPEHSDAAQAPKGFFGVHPLSPVEGDYPMMAHSDVGLIRTGFAYKQFNSPQGLEKFDAIVGGAAAQGIDVLPVVIGTDSDKSGATPLDTPKATTKWKQYLKDLVERYGPSGSFWDGKPPEDVSPIEDWQIWNEPNSFNNWAKPSPKKYGKLLALSAKTIHATDPSAKVISAGVISQPVNRKAEDGDVYLKKMLKSKAAARAADAIAVHPYTGKVKDVKKQIKLTRKVMNRAKLKKTPIWVTEIGWGEGKSSNPLIVSAAKQRKNLRASFQMMLKERRKLKIAKVVWYQWQDGPDAVCGWCSTSGLLEENGTEKPLLHEFKTIARR